MTEATRQRLFGYQHALDHPAVVVMLIAVGGIVVLTPLVMIGLRLAGVTKPDLQRELIRRYLSWMVMVPIVLLPILAGAAWTVLLFTVVSVLCYREFARATGFFRDKFMSLMVVLGIAAVAISAADHWYACFAAIPPLGIVIMSMVAIVADRPKGFIQRIGLGALSLLLFAVCLGHLSYFANDTNYRPMLLLLIVCVGMNDVFAFVVGKSIGGPKLAPNTSPNKTISGSLGAVVLTTALFFVLGREVFKGQLLGQPHHLIILGVIVSVAGQFGDLTISSVKRDIGVKDMGSIIPGHGGVLDRCNSLLLAAPAMFHYVGYFQGVGNDQPTRIFTGP